MFEVRQSSFEKISKLKSDKDLEIFLYLYRDEELMFYEIFYNNKLIGIIIFKVFKSEEVYIEYFEVLKEMRLKGLGRKFIEWLIDNIRYLNTRIFLTPIDECLEFFWKRCGFIDYKNNEPMLCYELKRK